MKPPQSLYIHIPFCRSKCIYCDFYSISYERDAIREYVHILCRQIRQLAYRYATVYIGGGTPSLLSVPHWRRLLKEIQGLCSRECEYTVEVNPESVTMEKLKLLREHGVNRISVGLQSLRDTKLKFLGRIHSARQGRAGLDKVQRAGFDNISIDCMFGLPQEKLSDWKRELAEIALLPVTHISAYALTCEKGTPLYAEFTSGAVQLVSEQESADMYAHLLGYLPQRAFKQYEVSNFAKKGYECKHNYTYWRNQAYTGLGPSAVSYESGARRIAAKNISVYMQRARRNRSLYTWSETLTPLRRARETAALKIRTTEGICAEWFQRETQFPLEDVTADAIELLAQQKLIHVRMKQGRLNRVVLTQRGFLFADTVSSSFL